MQQFIDKLISRLEEKRSKYEDLANGSNFDGWAQEERIYLAKEESYDNAVSIVNQLAEEYKKEWSKDYGWKLTKRFIEEKYFKRIYEISEKYDYPCENISLDMNWMFGLIEKIENKFTEKYKPRTNFDACCESVENMATIIDIAKVGWTKKQIVEWLQSEVKEGDTT